MQSELLSNPHLRQVNLASLYLLSDRDVILSFAYVGDFSKESLSYFYQTTCASLHRDMLPDRVQIQTRLYLAITNYSHGNPSPNPAEFIGANQPPTISLPIATDHSTSTTTSTQLMPETTQNRVHILLNLNEILLQRALRLIQEQKGRELDILLASINKNRRKELQTNNLFQIFYKLYLSEKTSTERHAGEPENKPKTLLEPIFFE